MTIQKYIFCEYCMLWPGAAKGFQPEGARFFREKVQNSRKRNKTQEKRNKTKEKKNKTQEKRYKTHKAPGSGGEVAPLPLPLYGRP